MTISNLIKMVESSPNGLKTLWEKQKLLVTSVLSVLQTCENTGYFRKGLKPRGESLLKTLQEKEKMLVTSIIALHVLLLKAFFSRPNENFQGQMNKRFCSKDLKMLF